MRVISPKRIADFAKGHADSAIPLKNWLQVAKKAAWKNLSQIRIAFPSADLVGRRTVFDIKGNRYRLIARVNFNRGVVFILRILTHAEYDKGNWKK